MQVNHLGQEGSDARGRDADGNVDAQGTTIRLIDHIQRSEDATAVERVAHEIESPDGIHSRLDQQRLSRSLRDPSLGTTRQIEPQLAVHPPDSLVVPTIALCQFCSIVMFL